MVKLSQLAPGERALDELAYFVAELNRHEAHQIGYLDADPAQVAAALAGLEAPPHESWVIAREDGRMVGALGFEADAELGRAWIYGPFVGHADWAAHADRLWAEVQTRLPDGLREHELFCNIHNTNCIAFAKRHAFPLHGDALIFRFGRESLASLPDSEARELTSEYSAAFQALHDQVFPRTYYSGRQILERINEHRKLFAIVESGVLLGYAYAEIIPEFGEGNLEFIGVSEQARGRGVGGRLMAAALGWMFGFPSMSEIFLTTNTTNTAAIKLYRKVGFQLLHTMRAFRKVL
jgi:ribosomal protein S18 acetylase RimI-like enzyme